MSLPLRSDSYLPACGIPKRRWLSDNTSGIVVSSRSAEDADVCAVIDHKNVQVRQLHSPAGKTFTKALQPHP